MLFSRGYAALTEMRCSHGICALEGAVVVIKSGLLNPKASSRPNTKHALVLLHFVHWFQGRVYESDMKIRKFKPLLDKPVGGLGVVAQGGFMQLPQHAHSKEQFEADEVDNDDKGVGEQGAVAIDHVVATAWIVGSQLWRFFLHLARSWQRICVQIRNWHSCKKPCALTSSHKRRWTYCVHDYWSMV